MFEPVNNIQIDNNAVMMCDSCQIKDVCPKCDEDGDMKK